MSIYKKNSTAEETLEAKKAFELYSLNRGVTIKAYHADNGIFRAKKWQQACIDARQRLSFTGVNAHHTNGMAEKRIRDLQDLTRAQMLHAATRWNNCITANLWPYAMRLANDALNNSPNPKDKARRSAENIFSSSNTLANAKHFKPFGCPVYVLEPGLQNNNPYHKWKERANVGVYLGKSPNHDRNVSLVLNLNTGLVSPQFHVKHDPSFDVVKQRSFKSKWQIKAGFFKEEDIIKVNEENNINIVKNIEPIMDTNNKVRKSKVSKKRRVRFAEPLIKRAKITQGGNLGPSEEKEKAAASTISAGTQSSKKSSTRPVRLTRSMTARSTRQTKNSSTLPQLIEVQVAEMLSLIHI